MRHKTTAVILLCVCVLLTVAAVVLGALTLSNGGAEASMAAQPGGVPSPSDAQAQASAVPATEQALPTETPSEPAASTPEPTAPVPTAEPTSTPAAGPDVPEQPAAVTSEYFSDAAFLGNSVLWGLWYYDNDQILPSDRSHWYCADSMTIMGASPYAAQMAGYSYGKIYVGLGINEVTYDKDTLRAAFNTVIDQLRTDHPEATIYLVSVTPVSAYCDAHRISRSSVISFNDMLRQIAREKGVWYLDVYPVLCGEDGFLPSEVTPDGVHFTPAHYQKWFRYMTTHYVPDGHSPTVPIPTDVPDAEQAGQTSGQ